jgi:hypothetical protein
MALALDKGRLLLHLLGTLLLLVCVWGFINASRLPPAQCCRLSGEALALVSAANDPNRYDGEAQIADI